MSTELPPEWAFSRVQILTEGYWDAQTAKSHKMSTAFARYIAEREEAPVDPLLIEAKLILDENLSHGPSFHERHAEAMEIARAALRRGIELGKSS